jgi:lysozyme
MLSRKQKNQIRKFLSTVLIIGVLILSGWVLSRWLEYRKTRFISYPEFGIAIPESYSIHGIDVSKYQQSIVWDEVKYMHVASVQLGFTYIKATEGIDNVDEQFYRNWKKAKQAGMICGAYHFFIGSKDGRMQAENFIDKVNLTAGDLPPVLDIEQLNGANPVAFKKEIKRWLEVAENYYHIKPIIYTNVDFYNHYLGGEFDEYPLWVAHYYQEHQPRIKRDWIFWQHSDEGRVNGIVSRVDFNVFGGDSVQFKSLLIQ